MKFARLAIFGLLTILVPVSGWAKFSFSHKNSHASHQSHPKVAKLSGPYSVGGKHAKHSTYNYLGKKDKHHKAKKYRVTGAIPLPEAQP